jgi:transcriptional regulator with XRE-family HTH domain
MNSTTRFSDQIRAAVDASGMTRYGICKAIGLNQGAMSRFMNRGGGLSMDVLDRLAGVIGLSVQLPAGSKPIDEA